MPRDLHFEKQKQRQQQEQEPVDSATLTKSPEGIETPSATSMPNSRQDVVAGQNYGEEDRLQRDMRQEDENGGLHPYVLSLGLNDIDACTALEEATFPPNHRANREKLEYRFAACSELSLGLFSSTSSATLSPSKQPTSRAARPLESQEPERKAVLLAHVICTKTTNSTVKDEDMGYPKNWRKGGGGSIETSRSRDDDEQRRFGHKEEGRTIAVHSLAVVPEYQRRGLGRTLMKAWLQRMQASGVADRVALLAYERLVPFYEELGFENWGKSGVTFGDERWNDMVLVFRDDQDA